MFTNDPPFWSSEDIWHSFTDPKCVQGSAHSLRIVKYISRILKLPLMLNYIWLHMNVHLIYIVTCLCYSYERILVHNFCVLILFSLALFVTIDLHHFVFR